MLVVKIGPPNQYCQMSSRQIDKEIIAKVRRQDARFNIRVGPLENNGQAMLNTFVLEIHYEDSYNAHVASGFGSSLYHDYALATHTIAEEFCRDNDYTMCNHLNSYPRYQAIIEREKAT